MDQEGKRNRSSIRVSCLIRREMSYSQRVFERAEILGGLEVKTEMEMYVDIGGSKMLWSRRLLIAGQHLGNQSAEHHEPYVVIPESDEQPEQRLLSEQAGGGGALEIFSPRSQVSSPGGVGPRLSHGRRAPGDRHTAAGSRPRGSVRVARVE